jgi:hypothetical protein
VITCADFDELLIESDLNANISAELSYYPLTSSLSSLQCKYHLCLPDILMRRFVNLN